MLVFPFLENPTKDSVDCNIIFKCFQMLDYPVGCLPTGKVTSDDDKALADETQWATGNSY